MVLCQIRLIHDNVLTCFSELFQALFSVMIRSSVGAPFIAPHVLRCVSGTLQFFRLIDQLSNSLILRSHQRFPGCGTIHESPLHIACRRDGRNGVVKIPCHFVEFGIRCHSLSTPTASQMARVCLACYLGASIPQVFLLNTAPTKCHADTGH